MIWGIWKSWEAAWLLPWAWVLLFSGVWFIFSGISWKVRVLPWALAYILFVSAGYAYRADNFAFAPSTMSSLLAFLCFLVFLSTHEPKVRLFGREFGYQSFLFLAGLLGIICSLFAPFYLTDRPDASYLMPVFWNRSMGGSFTVLALAESELFWLGLVAAVILARSTPLLVFAGTWVSMRSSLMRSYFVAVGAAVWVYLHGIPDGTGRGGFWKIYWHAFSGQPLPTQLFGTHLGTLAINLPLAQASAGVKAGDQYFIWLHNDYFQALTELGYVGFALCAVAFIEIWRLAPRPQRSIAVGLGIFMMSDFPTHWMPEALLYWNWIRVNAVRSAYETVKVNSSTPSWSLMNRAKASRLLVTIFRSPLL